MIGGLSCRGCAVKVTLNTFVTHALDMYRTTHHLEVFVAINAVAHGRGDVKREVLDSHIVTALDGMLGVANDVEYTVALQLDLSLAVETGLLRTVSAVGKGVLGILFRTDLDALTIRDIDSCTAGVGQCESG